jgi:hypothetical protein
MGNVSPPAAGGDRGNVINVEGCFLASLRQMAMLATATTALDDESAQPGR